MPKKSYRAERLTPAQEELFRAFQSNLLSLISHELRTPLTGILNSLVLLQEPGLFTAGQSLQRDELLSTARRNALRLSDTLTSLLDLAAMETGAFRPRMREVDLNRILTAVIQSLSGPIKIKRTKIKIESSAKGTERLIADSQQLSRAIEVGMLAALGHSLEGAPLMIQSGARDIAIRFQVSPSRLKDWGELWKHVRARRGKVGQQRVSPFGGVLVDEREFLTRTTEGLQSELVLMHEILRVHGGRVDCVTKKNAITLTLRLPSLSDEQQLRAVLVSRVYESTSGVGSVAIGFVRVPKKHTLKQFEERLRKSLFRATDTASAVSGRGLVALVLNDCKRIDVPALVARLQREAGVQFESGIVCCPEEGTDPDQLIAMALRRVGDTPGG